MSLRRSSLLATSLVSLLAGRAHAQDAFGYEPGQSAGQLHDPLSGHSPWRIDGSMVQGGTFFGYASDTVYGCELDSQTVDQATSIEGMDSSAGCASSIVPWVEHDVMFTGDVFTSLPGGRMAVGAGTRMRLRSGASDQLPSMVASGSAFEQGNWEDIRLSGRIALEPGKRLGLAPLLSLRLDRDTRVSDEDAATSDPLELGPLYGLGHSLGLAVPVGFSLQRVPVHLSIDPEAALHAGNSDTADATVQLGIQPMRSWMRARANAVWTPFEHTAVLAEAALRVRNDDTQATAASSVEMRAGLRRSMLDEQLQLTAVVGGSPMMALGTPGLRAGLALRWTGRESPALPAPAEDARLLVLEVVGPTGEPLLPMATINGTPVALEAVDAGRFHLKLPPGPHSLALAHEGHASLTETIEAPLDGKWQMRRVLPTKGGDGVLVIDMRDPTGVPLPAVSVVLEHGDPSLPPVDLGEVCGGCDLTYRGLPTGPHMLALGAAGMAPGRAPIELGPTAPDPIAASVFLAPPVGQLDIQVLDEGGRPLPDATVTLVHPNGRESVALDGDGRVQPVVAPGRWLVEVSAAGRGRQRHELLVEPLIPVTHTLTLNLLPSDASGTTLRVEVVDADGKPVEGARITGDDQFKLTTGSGGKAWLDDLSPGELTLLVEHDDFLPVPERQLTLTTGEESELTIVLGWLPGALVLQSTDPDGLPVDSLVRIQGEQQVVLERTGPDGRLNRKLDAGLWQVQLADERHQPVGVDVRVDAARNTVLDVELVARPKPTEAGAEVTVYVVDEDRQPLEGALVFVGEDKVGSTSTEGTISTEQPPSEDIMVTVNRRYFDPWSEPIDNREDVTARLRSRLGQVQLIAQTPDGAPIAAQVRITGANGQTNLSRLGTDGQRQYRLARRRSGNEV